jgi:hypothetical protein
MKAISTIALQGGASRLGCLGFESASCMETKEFCGVTWPSKVLKGKDGNS